MDGNKRNNLRLTEVREKLGDSTEGFTNILLEIMKENFPITRKQFKVQISIAPRTPNNYDGKRNSPTHILIKYQISSKNTILKAVRRQWEKISSLGKSATLLNTNTESQKSLEGSISSPKNN